MNKKKIIGFSVSLGVLVLLLVGAIIAFFVIEPYKSKKRVQYSPDYLKYSETYNLHFDKKANEYYIIGLKDIKKSSLKIPEKIDNIPVTKIIDEENSFSDYQFISEIVISKYIKYIGVFTGNDIKPYRQPFLQATGVSRFTVDPDNQYFTSIDGVLYTKDEKTLLRYPNAKDFGLGYIEFVIPDQVEYIDEYSFYLCDSLESIKFGKNIKKVGYMAFYNCINLQNVELNDGLISLGKDSFYDCENLSAITLPKSLSIVEDGCFTNCKKLREITILSEDPTLIGAFSGITSQKVNSETQQGEVSNIYFYIPVENTNMIDNFQDLNYVKNIGINGLSGQYAKAFIFLNNVKGIIEGEKIVYDNKIAK